MFLEVLSVLEPIPMQVKIAGFTVNLANFIIIIDLMPLTSLPTSYCFLELKKTTSNLFTK